MKILAFSQDETGDWMAELECGHTQHIRHNPPWTLRPWVLTEEGRSVWIGRDLACNLSHPPLEVGQEPGE